MQEQLGHSRIGITLDKYSHLMRGVKTEVGKAMEAFISEGKATLAASKEAQRHQKAEGAFNPFRLVVASVVAKEPR